MPRLYCALFPRAPVRTLALAQLETETETASGMHDGQPIGPRADRIECDPARPVHPGREAASSPESARLAKARLAEARLLERARSGDRGAFEALVTAAFPMLVRFCARLGGDDQAMDLAQEAVLKGLRGVARFRGDARFSSWLCRIARNTFLNERARLRHRRERSAGEGLDERAAASNPPAARAERRELADALEQAIRALPETQRTALLLCDRDQKSYQAIAEIMGTPIGTVMSRIYYARKKLRTALERSGAL